MERKKNWLIGIVGIIVLLMTAASVTAADPLERGAQPQNDTGAANPVDDNAGSIEPVLIATGDFEKNQTSDIPDYQNYTGDLLISPGPEGSSQTASPLNFPLLGVIGAAVIIGLTTIVILIKRKQKK